MGIRETRMEGTWSTERGRGEDGTLNPAVIIWIWLIENPVLRLRKRQYFGGSEGPVQNWPSGYDLCPVVNSYPRF